MKKEIKKILRQLDQQGWRIKDTGKHIKAYPPDRSKRMVVLPRTPSDHRALKNAISQLRRSGARL